MKPHYKWLACERWQGFPPSYILAYPRVGLYHTRAGLIPAVSVMGKTFCLILQDLSNAQSSSQ